MEKKTLEEAAEKEFPLLELTIHGSDKYVEEENLHLLGHRKSFIKGAKWQQEQDKNKYSEEEVSELIYNIIGQYANQVNIMIDGDIIDRLFEQFKKK